jgi:hypothetical protein
MDHKIFIKTLYPSGGSRAAVESEYRQDFPIHVAPSGDIFYRTIKQPENGEGSVCDKRGKGRKCSTSVRTE